ncbi:CsbD family protein [Candidatus Saccharibacteria bacterium]|nr:CsbD family protein [Candidatus Saccharibacteria bacterium]
MNDDIKKAEGTVKEFTGKVTGDEELEAKGKIEKKTVEVKENIEDKVEDVKQKVAGEVNDVMDKTDESK